MKHAIELSRLSLRGPFEQRFDLALIKSIPLRILGEQSNLQFRAEAFNTTNTPPFSQPTGQLNFTNLSQFSAITSTKNSNENNGARTLQLALKLFY